MMKKFAAIMILAAMLLSMMAVPALASAPSEDPRVIGDYTYTMPRPFYYDSERSQGALYFTDGESLISIYCGVLSLSLPDGKLGESGRLLIDSLMNSMYGPNMNLGIQVYEEHTPVAGMETYSARAMGMANGQVYSTGFFMCYDNNTNVIYGVTYNNLEMKPLVEQFLDSFQHI